MAPMHGRKEMLLLQASMSVGGLMFCFWAPCIHELLMGPLHASTSQLRGPQAGLLSRSRRFQGRNSCFSISERLPNTSKFMVVLVHRYMYMCMHMSKYMHGMRTNMYTCMYISILMLLWKYTCIGRHPVLYVRVHIVVRTQLLLLIGLILWVCLS